MDYQAEIGKQGALERELVKRCQPLSPIALVDLHSVWKIKNLCTLLDPLPPPT